MGVDFKWIDNYAAWEQANASELHVFTTKHSVWNVQCTNSDDCVPRDSGQG